MPAFAREQSGPLSEQQVSILVDGIREAWAKPIADLPADLPVYQLSASDPTAATTGDSKRGQILYTAVCSGCHGSEGQGATAGAINSRALGRLVSDTVLRRLIITGRPDLKMPDFIKSGLESSLKRPLNADEIVDLVAYVRSLQGRDVARANRVVLFLRTKYE